MSYINQFLLPTRNFHGLNAITSLHKAVDTVNASGCLYLIQMDNNIQLNHRRNIWQVAKLLL